MSVWNHVQVTEEPTSDGDVLITSRLHLCGNVVSYSDSCNVVDGSNLDRKLLLDDMSNMLFGEIKERLHKLESRVSYGPSIGGVHDFQTEIKNELWKIQELCNPPHELIANQPAGGT